MQRFCNKYLERINIASMLIKRLMQRYFVPVLLVCSLAFCLTGCGTNGVQQEPQHIQTPAANSDTVEEGHAQEAEMTEEEKIESLFRKCAELTYCIFTSTDSNGTGFLYKGEYVITNAHVLYEADDFYLKDVDGNEHKGSVVFKDDSADIAVIRLDEKQNGSVRFGDSDTVAVGEQLLMIGNPYNGDPFSFCTGKRLELDEELRHQINRREQFIHLDADIVSGYSGGPAFNMAGELIGISNAAYIGDLSAYDFDHLSLIIPINRVRDMIDASCQ